VIRDRVEQNLNSINFLEFNPKAAMSDATLKRKLLKVAVYKRTCHNTALKKLKDVVRERSWEAVNTFCNVQ
jgi:hypothetical protein